MSCLKKIDDDYTHIKAEKGLDEEVDFSISYTKLFALVDPVDVISTSTWSIIGAGGVLGAMTATGDVATAWVSGGGRIGNVLRLTNTIVTAGGRTHTRLIIIKVVNRLALVPATAG